MSCCFNFVFDSCWCLKISNRCIWLKLFLSFQFSNFFYVPNCGAVLFFLCLSLYCNFNWFILCLFESFWFWNPIVFCQVMCFQELSSNPSSTFLDWFGFLIWVLSPVYHLNFLILWCIFILDLSSCLSDRSTQVLIYKFHCVFEVF